MYDEMWEDHTEDIFDEITEAQALSDSIYTKFGEVGFLTKMWAEALRFDRLAMMPMVNKLQEFTDEHGVKKLKFRRYADLPTETLFEGGIK